MTNFIFLTTEGFTFQPHSTSPEPDIENCQLIGFGLGDTAREAFLRMVAESSWLKDTSFDEIYCYQLADNYKESKEFFSLADQGRKGGIQKPI